MDRRYADRVALLVDLLPHLDTEPRFALKGGTAINLFEQDLPRLSVDIDLAWLPTHDFQTDAADIAKSLDALGQRLASPSFRLQVVRSAEHRLIVGRGRARVQIETTPVMRGALHPVRRMNLQPRVEREFGSAQAQVLHFADLYAGKLAAALSRQHPRDLFDVGLLLDGAGIGDELWRTFLVYLTVSPKPAAEMLDPGVPRDFAAVFDRQFRGMTREPTSADALLEVRDRLRLRMRELCDAATCSFLRSVEDEQPAFDAIGLPQAARLPGVRRKLQNLTLRDHAKRAADRRQLEATLTRIALR